MSIEKVDMKALLRVVRDSMLIRGSFQQYDSERRDDLYELVISITIGQPEGGQDNRILRCQYRTMLSQKRERTYQNTWWKVLAEDDKEFLRLPSASLFPDPAKGIHWLWVSNRPVVFCQRSNSRGQWVRTPATPVILQHLVGFGAALNSRPRHEGNKPISELAYYRLCSYVTQQTPKLGGTPA